MASKLTQLKTEIRTVSRAVGYVYKQNLKAAIASDIIFLIITLLEMYSITVWGYFIDAVAKILTNATEFNLREFYISDAFWFLSLSTIIWLLSKIASSINSHFNTILMQNYYRNIKELIINKIANENLQEVEDIKFQKLLEFVQNYSIDNIWWAYNSFTTLLKHLITLITSMIILLTSIGPTALFLIFIALPEAIYEFKGQKNIADYLDKTVERVKEINYINSIILDIKGFIELKVSGLFSYFKKLFSGKTDKQNSGFSLKNMHFLIDKTLFSITDQILFRIYSIYLIALAITEKFSIGQFQATYNYASSTYSSAYNALNRIFELRKNGIYIEKFYQFLKYEGFGDVSYGEKKLKKGTPKLEFKNIGFQYKHEKIDALNDVSFKIKPGEKVAFIGQDGSGKSTLLKILCGLYEVKQGDYLIDAISVKKLARGELKNKISVMDESFNAYYFTLKENIVPDKRKKVNTERYEKVKKAALITKFMKSEGLTDSQLLGKFFAKGRDISPGYWQRLAIARLLYQKADIYIVDEPFTFIDQASRKEILKNMINFIGDDKTLIFITQDEENLELFDKVYRIKNGKIKK